MRRWYDVRLVESIAQFFPTLTTIEKNDSSRSIFFRLLRDANMSFQPNVTARKNDQRCFVGCTKREMSVLC